MRHWHPKREGAHEVGRISKQPAGLFYITILELPLDLLNSVCLYDITNLDIIVSLDVKTAIHTGMHFLCIILEPLERSKFSGVDHDTVTDHTHLGGSLKLTLTYDSSGNSTHLGNLECLLNLGSSSDDLLLLRLKHTLDTALEFIDTVIDDRVETNLNLLLLSKLAGTY